MNFSSQFSPQSKLIIFSSSEKWKVENIERFKQFLTQWKAHQVELKTEFHEINNYLIALTINEDYNVASGCSLDSLTRFLKEIEPHQKGIFNRFNIFINNDNEVELHSIDELKELLKNNVISENTLYFDTLINNVQMLEKDFLKPIKQSWFWKQII